MRKVSLLTGNAISNCKQTNEQKKIFWNQSMACRTLFVIVFTKAERTKWVQTKTNKNNNKTAAGGSNNTKMSISPSSINGDWMAWAVYMVHAYMCSCCAWGCFIWNANIGTHTHNSPWPNTFENIQVVTMMKRISLSFILHWVRFGELKLCARCVCVCVCDSAWFGKRVRCFVKCWFGKTN